MRATEQYFPVVQFSVLYMVGLTFWSMGEIVNCYHQMRTLSMQFLLSIVLSKMILTFELMDEIREWSLRWNIFVQFSTDVHLQFFFKIHVYFNCCSEGCNLSGKSSRVSIQMKTTEQYFPVVLFIMLYKMVLTFKSEDEILKCDHSNESYWGILSCCTVYLTFCARWF